MYIDESQGEIAIMQVDIVLFPFTNMAVVEYFGSPANEYKAVDRLIRWRKKVGFLNPQKYQCYGIHYTNPAVVDPSLHHVDFGISVDEPILANPYGVIHKTVPKIRCAKARDIGSRAKNKAIIFLLDEWLPKSGEQLGDFPPIFHYVNVGLDVAEAEEITDVYLPLKQRY